MITRCTGCGKVLVEFPHLPAPLDAEAGGYWLPPVDTMPEFARVVRGALCPACGGKKPGSQQERPASTGGPAPDALGEASIADEGTVS